MFEYNEEEKDDEINLEIENELSENDLETIFENIMQENKYWR